MSELLSGAGLHPRFLAAPATGTAPGRSVDVLVVGAGIAGLSVALSLPEQLQIVVALKGATERRQPGGLAALDGDGSTGRAQGGIAAVLGADDSPALHLEDTLEAGAGLCEETAAGVLVKEAPAAIAFLESCGVRLDRRRGAPDLTREGGHSRRRIVHAGGDATGREVMRGLLRAAQQRGLLLRRGAFVVDLLTASDGRVCGALLDDEGALVEVRARAVVLATGGFGRLYAETTSPPVCTGDGLAAALRAGARVRDLEFVQFHPTAIRLARDPRPLATEALRGEGAVIRDGEGELVMAGVAPAGDLAPRDVVSRTMALAMRRSGADHLFLDATAIGSAIGARFPTFARATGRAGIDPSRRWVPIAPAVHYVMGGVATDLFGRASLPGLYAVGEVASSGVHGANRLASNSLVEGVVFGRRAAAAIADELGARPLVPDAAPGGVAPTRAERGRLRARMSAEAGVLRNGAGLRALSAELAGLGRPLVAGAAPAALEEANLLTIGRLVTAAALRREESRGAHYRLDFPAPAPTWRRHQSLIRTPDGAVAVADEPLGAAPRTRTGGAFGGGRR